MKVLLIVAVAVLGATLAVAFTRASAETVDRKPQVMPDPLAVRLPMPETGAAAAVGELLRGRKGAPNPAFQAFATAATGDPIFPTDDQLLSAAADNRALRAYVAIAPALRKRDLYFFEPTGDRYWFSEYRSAGAPVKFRCAFLVHLEPLSAKETEVDVLEYTPAVAMGQTLGLGAHGPGFLQDIRPVAPTRSDRAQMLQWIGTLAPK